MAETKLTEVKQGKFRVKRFDSKKDVIIADGFNGNTNIHTVQELDVNANDSDDAIKVAMLFLPPAFGATRFWSVSCLALGGAVGMDKYPGSDYIRSDIYNEFRRGEKP